MTRRSGGVSGRDMLAYGFKVGEPWAEDRRAFEQAFRELDAQSNSRSHGTYGNLGGQTRTSSELDDRGMSNTMNPITSRRGSAAYLYPDGGNSDSDYAETPSVRFNQNWGARNERVASDNGFRSGTIYSRHERGRYLYSNRHSEYDEDVRVSPRRWDHARYSWRDEHFYESDDDPHATGDRDSDWEDGQQEDGSGGSLGMFDHDQERWHGSSEYDDHHERDFDSEGEYYYYESGSEAFENESHYGSEYSGGSSGEEDSYVSESDVGSDWSYSDDVYYYDSD